MLEQKLYALTRSAQTRHRKNQKHLPETETLNVRHTTIEPYPIRSQVGRPFQSQHGAFGLSLPCVKLWTWDSRFWLSCLGFCLSCDRVLGLLWILLAAVYEVACLVTIKPFQTFVNPLPWWPEKPKLRSDLPLVSREWRNGSNSSYSCTPFLHSLLTKRKPKAPKTRQSLSSKPG